MLAERDNRIAALERELKLLRQLEVGALQKCPLWVKSGHMQCNSHVRFTPNSDRESGFPQKAMSALPPKADMCGATRDVRFVPIADICVELSCAKRKTAARRSLRKFHQRFLIKKPRADETRGLSKL